jgi:hypothetical protein
MRKTLLMSAALFGVAVVAPAFAQTSPMQSTQTPASSQSGSQAPQPANSMPPGAAGMSGNTLNQTGGSQTYRGNTSTGTSSATPGSTTGATAPGLTRSAAGGNAGSGSADAGTAVTEHPMGRHPYRRHSGHAGMNEMGARPGHEPGVGQSEPFSNRASNINQSDSRSQIAPRLPTPGGGENASPEMYLRDAQRALGQNRTGAAQEALERAETAFLNNPSNPAEPGGQVGGPMQQAVEQARQALGNGNRTQARQLVDQALAQAGSGGSMGGGGAVGGGGAMGGGSMDGPSIGTGAPTGGGRM